MGRLFKTILLACLAFFCSCHFFNSTFDIKLDAVPDSVVLRSVPETVFSDRAAALDQAKLTIQDLPASMDWESFCLLPRKPGLWDLVLKREGFHDLPLVFNLKRGTSLVMEESWVVKQYPVSMELQNVVSFRVLMDDLPLNPAPGSASSLHFMIPWGSHAFTVQAEGYADKHFSVHIDSERCFSFMPDPENSLLGHLKTVAVGSLPKGMSFSRDGRWLFVSLLGQAGVEVLDMQSWSRVQRIIPGEDEYRKDGFVEVFCTQDGKAALLSKMTTDSLHVISLDSAMPFSMEASFSTRGTWSKVISASPDGKLLAVSNWVSQDITFFSYPDYSYQGSIEIPGIPRGMVFSHDGRQLYAGNYSSGELHIVDSSSFKITSTIKAVRPGALRHLVLHPEKSLVYASDMYNHRIYCFDMEKKRLLAEVQVDKNPNTIALSPDGAWLFVSCRGPNDPDSYLNRSPRSGSLYTIRTSDLSAADIRTLGNQPTALAVHPSGSMLAVSNFMDNNLELFSLSALDR